MYVSIIPDYSVGVGKTMHVEPHPLGECSSREKVLKFTYSEVSEVASSPLKLATIDY